MALSHEEDGSMSRKRHRPEEIVAKLRQVEVLTAQGRSVAVAIRSIGVTEVSSGTSCSTARSSPRSRRPRSSSRAGAGPQLLIRTHISLCYWYEEALLRRVRYRGVFCAARRLPGEDSDGRALEIFAAEHPRALMESSNRGSLCKAFL